MQKCLITTNKNMVPYDQKSPLITSGIRLGTPALTSRDMKEEQMVIIADLINSVLSNIDNDSIIEKVKKSVIELTDSFPLYKEILYEMS